VGGRAAAARLFPDALWVPYTDPGYTLCMAVRTAVRAYQAEHGREPALIFLESHGVFVSGDTAEDIRAAYGRIVATLGGAYRAADVFEDCWPEDDGPLWSDVDAAHGVLKAALGEDAAFVAAAASERIGAGPVSPDHIVYAKSYPFTGALTAENLLAFKEARGYAPRVVVAGRMLLGVGKTDKTARLALELALDGAQVRRYAHAFGGLKYLDDRARGFIENWEVESYRAKQV
jgi:rhamnose utilization protein RhaD (predicted bifunctional aldolase and dehydrogenase)